VCATGACGAALESATLILRQAAPDSSILTGFDCPLQAGVDNFATTANGFCLFDLKERWPSVPDWEKQLWVFFEARGAVTPIH
jgi:hypothetical protein